MPPPPDAPLCCPPEDLRAAARRRAPAQAPAADAALAALARAIAHPVRVRILRLLARRHARMCSHIVDELPLAQSTVSEHLRILRDAGLVQANEDGPRVGYCLVPSALARLTALLEAVSKNGNASGVRASGVETRRSTARRTSRTAAQRSSRGNRRRASTR